MPSTESTGRSALFFAISAKCECVGKSFLPLTLSPFFFQVENWCPVLKGREEFKKKHVAPTSQNLAVRFQISFPPALLSSPFFFPFQKTEINTDLQSLLKILSGPKLEWVCGRITRMWPDWQKSANSLAVASASTIIGRPKRNVSNIIMMIIIIIIIISMCFRFFYTWACCRIALDLK